ncbi:MAG TPA: GNAT family N-acetyltransferase [Rhizomicrobium sp.]
MQIRPYRPGDAPQIGTVFRRAILEVGVKDYTAEQVAAWAGAADAAERLHARLSDRRLALVAVDDRDGVLAFGDLEADGHIDFLYAAPEAVGKGVASALYDALEAAARERKVARLYTEASEAARRLFLKKGFKVLRRREFAVRGVPIHNYAMEKIL